MSSKKRKLHKRQSDGTAKSSQLLSNGLAFASLLVSLLSLYISIWIGTIANEFSIKNSHLNYFLSADTPVVVDDVVCDETPNFRYNLTPYTIHFDPLSISGEYKKVVFAAIDNGNIDITAFSHEINTPEYSGNRGYYFQSGEVIVVVEFEKEYISFNLNKFNEKSPNYSILHIILQGYNGEYQIFTMIYSTTSFKSYILDNISLNSISLITQIKEELDDDEIHTLVSAFGDSALEERNRCWVILMCDSGLRRGEIINLQIGNVHLARGFMIVTGKGDKQRFVPLGELSKISLATYIRKYRNEAKESEPVFVNRFGEKCTINTVKQVFQKLKKQTGILRLHAHLLRHTFATNYLVDGGDLETLRLLMGHSDLQVTMMYLHLAENKKLLQRKHQSHLDMIINS